MASGYVDVLTPSEFTFKTVPDIKFGDYRQILDVIPEPWVADKRFSMHGYVTHKHAVNPTGLDEEERAAHKIPQEAQKLSDTLAKEQGEVRTRLVKLQLPAAELAKHLHTITYPFDNPKCLANSLRQQGAQEETEGTDARSELEQFEAVVHEAFSRLNEQLRVLSDRLTLASHLSFLQDYDLQMQRAAAVAPQNKQVVALAFGREQQRSFSPHSNLPAERMKMPKMPTLQDAKGILDIIEAQQKGPPNARKGKRPAAERLRIEDIKTAMSKEEGLTVACPIFQIFGSEARCADSGRCKPHRCTVCESVSHGALEEEACEVQLRASLAPPESKLSKTLINPVDQVTEETPLATP